MDISHLYNDFWDVSIIIPFYKNLDVFTRTLKKTSHYFIKNGVEVIITMNERTEQEGIIALIEQYPFINWKVIVNNSDHEWPNFSKAINVGIKAAACRYILIVESDNEFSTDIISTFRSNAAFYNNSFFLVQNNRHISVFAEKVAFEQIRGCNEKITDYYNCCNEVIARLEFSGCKKMIIPVAVSAKNDITNIVEHRYIPECSIVNDPYWGTNFHEVVYSYERKTSSYCQLLNYLSAFENYEVVTQQVFNQKRKVVALVTTYNEKKHIRGLLENLETVCDGVILLDDGSIDDTYDLASFSNVLLKVRQKRADKFEDLRNRNILLQLASFFDTDWLFFMDADERFDPRFSDIRAIGNASPSPTICFYLVHLWDRDDMYRANVPEKGFVNMPGVLCRWRMFRKFGHMQIYANTHLHFPATPYKSDMFLAPVLVLHFGMKDTAIRKAKKERYEREDPDVEVNRNKYSYFNDDHIELAAVAGISDLPAKIYSKKNLNYVPSKGRFSPLSS